MSHAIHVSVDATSTISILSPPKGVAGALLSLQGDIVGPFLQDSLSISVGGASCSLLGPEGDLLSLVYAPSVPLTPSSAAVCALPFVPPGQYNVSLHLTEQGLGLPTATALRSDGATQLFTFEQARHLPDNDDLSLKMIYSDVALPLAL